MQRANNVKILQLYESELCALRFPAQSPLALKAFRFQHALWAAGNLCFSTSSPSLYVSRNWDYITNFIFFFSLVLLVVLNFLALLVSSGRFSRFFSLMCTSVCGSLLGHGNHCSPGITACRRNTI